MQIGSLHACDIAKCEAKRVRGVFYGKPEDTTKTGFLVIKILLSSNHLKRILPTSALRRM